MVMKEKVNLINKMNKVYERLVNVANLNQQECLEAYKTSLKGLDTEQINASREKYGENIIKRDKRKTLAKRLFDAFFSPFSMILMVLAIVSFFSEVIYAPANERKWLTVFIILMMVVLSGILKFNQESKSGEAAEKLRAMVKTTTNVSRAHTGKRELPLEEVVVGDIITLAAGDIIPGDLRILVAKDLFITQASLSGESIPVEKTAEPLSNYEGRLIDADNLVFMGCDVISGSALGLVVAVGDETMLGSIANKMDEKEAPSSFEIGINNVSWILIRFMVIMVPIIFILIGLTKGDWGQAFLFAITIAVGLTPEMLPMITTTCLSKGALSLSKKKVIVKKLDAISNFGAMNILCTDKTGTLTQDRVVLEYHLDADCNTSVRVLRHGLLNSYFQTGLKNLIDIAVIEYSNIEGIDDNFIDLFEKVDEIPFDFNRRRMSVVVADKTGKTQLITKGAIEEILSICSFVEYQNEVRPITQELIDTLMPMVNKLNSRGMRVIAVAQKSENLPTKDMFNVEDESEMVLMGYLAFLDPPKETTATAVKALYEHGVDIKILTGDNDLVAQNICERVGIQSDNVLLGQEMSLLTKEELMKKVEEIHVFAKLTPIQKAEIVTILRELGHTVGFMGDGINDALAMKKADVAISVDTAVDVAKESAQIILLEKDLMVLENGIIEGRKTYINMIKYIKMTASSNFGNMFSVLVAGAFLPFLPMMAIQLILLNLIYDIACIAIPWDNVDEEYLKRPKKWEPSGIVSFMCWMGPISSIFDITTFLFMFFIAAPILCGQAFFNITDTAMKLLFISIFQTGWFIESMWTQSLVIHMIRTPKIPFIQSSASKTLTLFTSGGIILLTLLPYTFLGESFGLSPLPLWFFIFLVGTVFVYMLLITIVKKIYIKKFGKLL